MLIWIIDALTVLNSLLLLAIVIALGIWTRANETSRIAQRTSLERSVLHLEKELADLKAGSIIQLPPLSPLEREPPH